MSIRPIRIHVPGIPATQGSAKAFVVAGRARITHANSKTIPWRNTIGAVAATELAGRYAPAGRLVHIDAHFVFPRPPSHWRKTGGVRRGAPRYPRLDLDKLVRALLDALTGVAYDDDSQVTSFTAHKEYAATPDTPPGLTVLVTAPWTDATETDAA